MNEAIRLNHPRFCRRLQLPPTFANHLRRRMREGDIWRQSRPVEIHRGQRQSGPVAWFPLAILIALGLVQFAEAPSLS